MILCLNHKKECLFVLKKVVNKLLLIFSKNGELDVAVIGEVTSSGHMELFWHGEKVADVPVQPVSEEAPVLDRPVGEPEYLKTIQNVSMDKDISNQVVF